ncbi:MAG TPA: hypothetical protein VFS17_08170 [Methylophilaceae bacterium]|nr:hypothetical protein [Methylophilaceae bacterium]
MSTRILSGLGLVLLALQAQAAPMGFKDSWMSMGDFSPNWREVFANYATTPRDAFGLGYTYMRSDDEEQTRNLAELNYTHLFKRWNLRDAQANFWFIGGIGALRGNDFDGTKTMVSPGIQFDYETTRVYFSATQRLYRAHDINHDFSSVRAGFSFYETDYDQTQPWFILEARHMNDLSDKVEVTPMLRLINKNYFVEAGVNNSSQLRFNFMYIF